MSTFPKYESYKDSGIEWLGEIPSHWEVLPGRAYLNSKKVKNTGNEVDTILSLSYGKIIVKPEEKLHGLVPESFETYQIVEPGDIIVRATDLQNDQTSLRIGLVENKGIITSAYLCLHPSEAMDSRFAYYLLHSYDLLKVYYGMGSGLRQNLDYTDFKYLPLAIPTIEEQKRIVEFLDRTTSEIDRAISQKQRLIELLQEQKAILINQAVTKGLNPNVPMKDSGIEWIGEIPEHWKVSKLGHYAKVTNGSTPSRDNPNYWENGTIPWLSSGKVNDFVITEPSELITPKALRECSIRLYPKGSVIIGMIGQGKTRGTTAFLDIEACINQNMAAIEPGKKINGEFLHRYLIQAYQYIRDCGKGANQEALNCDLIRSFLIVIPPINEQVEAVNHLKVLENSFSKLLDVTLQEIELLSEYRSLIISNAVTGKIKV